MFCKNIPRKILTQPRNPYPQWHSLSTSVFTEICEFLCPQVAVNNDRSLIASESVSNSLVESEVEAVAPIPDAISVCLCILS